MKKYLILDLLILLASFTLLYSNQSASSNFLSYPPEKRIGEFISTLLKTTNLLENYKSYIASNGLIMDDTFEKLKMQIETNSNFVLMVNSSLYQTTSNFFSDFKEFSQTYAYLVFSQLFQKESKEEYVKKLEGIEKEYQIKSKDPKLNKVEKTLVEHTLKSIALMEEKMKEYDSIQKNMKDSVLKTVKEKQKDLKEMYKNITE